MVFVINTRILYQLLYCMSVSSCWILGHDTSSTEHISITLPTGIQTILCNITNNNNNVTTTTQQHSFSSSITTPAPPAASIMPPPTSTQSTFASILRHCKDYCWSHTLFLVTSGCILTYGTLASLLFFYKHVTCAQENWSLWHQEISLENLLKIPPTELARALRTDSTLFYSKNTGLVGVDYVIRFIQDIDKELQQLHRFVQLHTFLKRIKLLYCMPTQEENLAIAQNQIERLHYLRRIVIQWLGEPSNEQIPSNQKNI